MEGFKTNVFYMSLTMSSCFHVFLSEDKNPDETVAVNKPQRLNISHPNINRVAFNRMNQNVGQKEDKSCVSTTSRNAQSLVIA